MLQVRAEDCRARPRQNSLETVVKLISGRTTLVPAWEFWCGEDRTLARRHRRSTEACGGGRWDRWCTIPAAVEQLSAGRYPSLEPLTVGGFATAAAVLPIAVFVLGSYDMELYVF